MKVCNLSSGSDGNITYIETQSAKILVDCGLSCKNVVERLARLNVNPNEIDAIIISHEHSDHIKGIEVFAKKYKTNIYAHSELWRVLERKFIHINPVQFVRFEDNEFKIKDLTVSPVDLPHDSTKCNGFTFWEKEKKISIITDLGHTNSRILDHIKDSRLIYLECNHNEKMLLANDNYSATLKRRILGSNGHLSNIACAKAICELAKYGQKHIMLSHLSTKNNSPEIAYNEVLGYLSQNGVAVGESVMIGVTSINPSAVFNLN